MVVDFGKHKGQLYTRIPVSYLRWMVNSGHSRADIARAELERRGVKPEDRFIEISGHAIDRASLRVRKIWHETRGADERLHAWLVRMCEEALAEHAPDDEGVIVHRGMKLVFEPGTLYPTLKTVVLEKAAHGAQPTRFADCSRLSGATG